MLNILIVDDDINLCECLLSLMPWKDMDCNTPVVAYNGLEAWKILQHEKMDFVICDLKMPVMEGTKLCSLIYENKLKTQMVFLSAYEDFCVAKLALQYGVIDYILKPINRESLDNLEKIIRGINRKKIKKELSDKFFEEEYNRQIFNSLCNHDSIFIENMFDRLKMLEEQEIISAGMSLLHILYDYLCVVNKGVERSIYDNIFRKWRSDLMLLPASEDRIKYLHGLYQKELAQSSLETEAEFMVRQIKKLVDENYSYQEFNVAWIANKLHMSSAYLGRIFNKTVGIGLMEYITERRMKEACQLLTKENVSVYQVAGKVGYIDANYFTKAFRNKIGMSPSVYRKKCFNYE